MKFFLYALTLILITLNLTGVTALSWWLVFAPIIAIIGFYIGAVLAAVTVAWFAAKV